MVGSRYSSSRGRMLGAVMTASSSLGAAFSRTAAGVTIGPAQGRASTATASRATGRACDSIVRVCLSESVYVLVQLSKAKLLRRRRQEKQSRDTCERMKKEKESKQRAQPSFFLLTLFTSQPNSKRAAGGTTNSRHGHGMGRESTAQYMTWGSEDAPLEPASYITRPA